MKRIEKGEYGYVVSQKKKRTIITVIMFAIPLMIFLTGYFMTGTRKNMFTLVAILGCLPASKCAVSMIMMYLQKPLPKEIYETYRKHVKDLTALYEITVTAYEKSIPLECVVISGLNVVGCSENPKTDAPFAQEHIKKILQGNGYRANVKIFTSRKQFLQRVDELYAHREEGESQVSFKPDENHPGTSRNDLVKNVIMAISL